MIEPILLSPFFVNFILPFVLVFTLVFAVLQKTKVLGEDVRQINAIIGAVTGLLLIVFPFARGIVIQLMPFLAVSLTIILVFLLIYGFSSGKKDDDILGNKLKIAFGIIFGIAMIIALLVFTGFWNTVFEFSFGGGGNVWVNALMIVVIVGAIIAVLYGGK